MEHKMKYPLRTVVLGVGFFVLISFLENDLYKPFEWKPSNITQNEIVRPKTYKPKRLHEQKRWEAIETLANSFDNIFEKQQKKAIQEIDFNSEIYEEEVPELPSDYLLFLIEEIATSEIDSESSYELMEELAVEENDAVTAIKQRLDRGGRTEERVNLVHALGVIKNESSCDVLYTVFVKTCRDEVETYHATSLRSYANLIWLWNILLYFIVTYKQQ